MASDVQLSFDCAQLPDGHHGRRLLRVNPFNMAGGFSLSLAYGDVTN